MSFVTYSYDGHDLAREIIDIQGIDRYPTPELNFLKLFEEMGELVQKILKVRPQAEVAKEYGDVGLSLYALGTKLGLDLTKCMQDVVHNETRKFA